MENKDLTRAPMNNRLYYVIMVFFKWQRRICVTTQLGRSKDKMEQETDNAQCKVGKPDLYANFEVITYKNRSMWTIVMKNDIEFFPKSFIYDQQHSSIRYYI